MPTPPLIPDSVWRIYHHIVDRNARRYFFGETWMLEGGPTSSTWFVMLNRLEPLINRPFGNHPDLNYTYDHWQLEELWPDSRVAGAADLFPRPLVPVLNPAAPEAAFRLQRVGASGGIGRITYPILTDRYYLDLPHRRHVDIATLAPWLAGADDPGRYFQTQDGVNFWNVIWHRRDHTYELVTSHRILRNPVRVWQRWKPYDWVHRHSTDAAWKPDERN